MTQQLTKAGRKRLLSEDTARNCEEARKEKCACRCAGKFHGRFANLSEGERAEIPRSYYENLPEDDPHWIPSAEWLARRKARKDEERRRLKADSRKMRERARAHCAETGCQEFDAEPVETPPMGEQFGPAEEWSSYRCRTCGVLYTEYSNARPLLVRDGKVFVFLCAKEDRYPAKDAGFGFASDPRPRWLTSDPRAALKVASYATPGLRAEIEREAGDSEAAAARAREEAARGREAESRNWLRYDSARGGFVWRGPFEMNPEVKAADFGFRSSPFPHWFTTDPRAASRFSRYTDDPATLAMFSALGAAGGDGAGAA